MEWGGSDKRTAWSLSVKKRVNLQQVCATSFPLDLIYASQYGWVKPCSKAPILTKNVEAVTPLPFRESSHHKELLFFFSISDSVPISCNLSVIWLQWQPSPHNLQTEKFKKKFCIYLSVNDAVSMSFPLFSPFSWCQPLFRLLGISMNYWMQIHTYLVAERYTATSKDEVHLQTPHCGLFYQISDRIWSMYKPTIK